MWSKSCVCSSQSNLVRRSLPEHPGYQYINWIRDFILTKLLSLAAPEINDFRLADNENFIKMAEFANEMYVSISDDVLDMIAVLLSANVHSMTSSTTLARSM